MELYIGTKPILAEPAERDGAEGYRVRYKDGYESWSPVGAFEEAYRPNGQLDFGAALAALKTGGRVTRQGWNGKGMWLECQFPDAGSKMTKPYIYMKTAEGGLVPWLASQSDMLEEDWQVLAGLPPLPPLDALRDAEKG